uniref:Thioredoxin domain-containing protein n=1 Tax=Caenorhabditis japonica TaxID=281687 RepID=A0A8R1DRU6_CAEJA
MHEEQNDKRGKPDGEGLDLEADEKEYQKEEEEEEEIDSNVNAVIEVTKLFDKKRKVAASVFPRDIGFIFASTVALAIMIYFVLTFLGLTMSAKLLVVPKGAAKPFFLGRQRRLIEDNYDGALKISNEKTMSVLLLYSPYSFKSKHFREEYYNTARIMKKLYGNGTPFFSATNCFDSNNHCRRKYNLKQYPALMAQNSYLIGSLYNGPLNAVYVARWLNRLQNPLFRIQSSYELAQLAKHYDLMVVLFQKVRFTFSPNTFSTARNFTTLAFHYLNGDPNTERTIFCTVTDAELAAQFQLHNEHDVVILSSELKLLTTHHRGWTVETLYHDVVFYAQEVAKRSVEFLNHWNGAGSTQLAEKLKTGSVLMFFTPNIIYGDDKYAMLRETSREYLMCENEDHNFIGIETEKTVTDTDHEDDCAASLKSRFCDTNTTLSFMIVDSQVETSLASKIDAFENEVIIAVNAKQEITRFIRNNVTRENINCLIRQHHNAADNEFVSESSKLTVNKNSGAQDDQNDAIGEKSTIRFVNDVSEVLTSKKVNVILFSGGVWHSSSSSAMSSLHLAAHYFKESRSIIDFSIVDVSQTYVPYNLNFEQLPKILVTSTDSIGLSWTYPEDFMINHSNIVRFVLTRPGKIFGRLRWLNSCRGKCRKIARLEMRFERLQMKRQLSRAVSNRIRQRALIGYYDRMLRMMG